LHKSRDHEEAKNKEAEVAVLLTAPIQSTYDIVDLLTSLKPRMVFLEEWEYDMAPIIFDVAHTAVDELVSDGIKKINSIWTSKFTTMHLKER
jgi:hypothetical protein